MAEEKIIVQKGSAGSLAYGFIIGGLIGATVALLSAPQSGAETRHMIREKSGELRDKAKETAVQTREKAGRALENARGKVEDVTRATRERAAQAMDRGSETLEEGSRRMESEGGGVTGM
jgi:gas vesicle protein